MKLALLDSRSSREILCGVATLFKLKSDATITMLNLSFVIFVIIV
jgi:hypothetical protein